MTCGSGGGGSADLDGFPRELPSRPCPRMNLLLSILRLFLLLLVPLSTSCIAANSFLSPDGRLLAYGVLDYDDRAEPITHVHVCGVDGSGERRIATVKDHLSDLVWADRSTLLLSGFGSSTLHRISPNGHRLRPLVVPDDFETHLLVPAPDGRRLAFLGSHLGTGRQGLHLLDLRGTGPKLIREGVFRNHPIWLDAGARLALPVMNRDGVRRIEIMRLSEGNWEKTPLTGAALSPSDDGRFLALTTGFLSGKASWRGVPATGEIVSFDRRTNRLDVLSPGPLDFVLTGRRGTEPVRRGFLRPAWSCDGLRLAFWSWARVGTRSFGGIWIRERDRDGRARKVTDEALPFAWSPDGRALFLRHPTSISVLDVDGGKTKRIRSWNAARWPQPEPGDTLVLERPGVRLESTRFPPRYAEAIAAVLAEARLRYEAHGMKLPDCLTMTMERRHGVPPRFFTDGRSHFHLSLPDCSAFERPETGPRNLYAICHEMGHIVMYGRLEDLIGLSKGIGEGWATYTGAVIIDEVASRFGQTLWPHPYDPRSREGSAGVLRPLDDRPFHELSSDSRRGAKVFWHCETLHGRRAVFEAMDRALGETDGAGQLMASFRRALRRVTGDARAGAWIPSEQIRPKPFEWETAERELGDSFFEGQTVLPGEDGTILLKHDDGTAEGEASITGSGHAVAFRRPESHGKVVELRIFGSRYGGDEAGRVPFAIHLCNEDFAELHRVEGDRSLFPKAKRDAEGRNIHEWVRIPIPRLEVPERFYVCVVFRPTSREGVFMAYDTDVRKSHSRRALPGSHLRDPAHPLDWMIRVGLDR